MVFAVVGEDIDMNTKRITFNFIEDVCVKSWKYLPNYERTFSQSIWSMNKLQNN